VSRVVLIPEAKLLHGPQGLYWLGLTAPDHPARNSIKSLPKGITKYAIVVALTRDVYLTSPKRRNLLCT
jgi:hypothetical protein